MRIRLPILVLLVALTPLCSRTQSTGSHASENISRFVGVWRGQFDNLPGVDLVITNEGGGLRGAILFYLHKRADANRPYTSSAGLPEPIFNIHPDDQTLHFKVSHRRAHPPATLHDAPKDFDLKLTGPDHAQLTNKSGDAPGLTMTRTDY